MNLERSRKNLGCVKHTRWVIIQINNWYLMIDSTLFKDHFKDKNTELQPEVINPENYPRVLPPDDLTVNSNTPEIDEVQQVLKEFKNGKCLGMDLLHPEHFKYNKSNRFLVYLMLLLTTIWTTFIIPSLVSIRTKDPEMMQRIIEGYPLCQWVPKYLHH